MTDLELKDFNILMEMVLNESTSQLKKWGIQDHEPSIWLMFLTEELGELSQAISEWKYRDGHTAEIVKEAIQVSTLALKIAEMFWNTKDKQE